MRDHNYILENGQRIPVSKMSTEDIRSCLESGFVVDRQDGPGDRHECIRERLKIELLIRELNL